jgi:subtilisin family serine protease
VLEFIKALWTKCVGLAHHTTELTGTIGAVGNNDVGLTGVAWRVHLLGCKFLDDKGSGANSDAIECIRWCVGQGARIISNSWGSDKPQGPQYLRELTRVS